MWRSINEVVFGKTKSSRKDIILNVNDEMVHEEAEICTVFNNYFLNIAENITSSLDALLYRAIPFEAYNVKNSFVLHMCDESEILNIINEINGKAAVGWDEISGRYIKHYSASLVEYLVNQINLCLSTGEFPRVFKIAKIVPIYKSGR